MKSEFLNKAYYFIFAVTTCLLISYFFTATENDIYSFDFLAYWKMYSEYSALLFNNPALYFVKTFHEVYSQDYNPLASSLLAPIYYIFGDSRFVFISAIATCYLVPVGYLNYLIVKKASDSNNTIALVICLFVSVSFVGYWKPILRGYPDIVSMIPLLFGIYYLQKHSFSAKITFKRAIIIGILLWMPFVLRRWYAYTLVALYFSLPLSEIIWNKAINYKKAARNVIVNFAISGFTSVILVMVFQKDVAIRAIVTDYSSIYSAYGLPFVESIHKTIAHVGYFIFLSCLSCSALAYWKIKQSRKIIFILMSTLVISYILFIRTQSPGHQHEIPFMTWMLIPSLIVLSTSISKLSNKETQACTILTVISLSLIITSASIYRSDFSDKFNRIIFPEKVYQLKLDNYDNYLKMVSYVEEQLLNGDVKYISVISSGGVLNQSMFKYMSKGKLDKFIQLTPQVDLRDGLPLESLLSEYLIVVTPIDTHLPMGQEVIKITANEILSGKGLGSHYSEVKRFNLANNSNGIIYKKTSAFTPNDITKFISKFVSYYPDWESKYNNNKVVSLMTTKVQLGDGAAWFARGGDFGMITHPGRSNDSVIIFTPLKNSITLTSLSNTCQNADGIYVSYLSDDEKGDVHIELGKKSTIVLKSQTSPVTLRINKGQNDACDSLLIN